MEVENKNKKSLKTTKHELSSEYCSFRDCNLINQNNGIKINPKIRNLFKTYANVCYIRYAASTLHRQYFNK